MPNPLDELKDRVLRKKGKDQETDLTNILDMVRGFSCLGEIIGRDFEIMDLNGKLIYQIHQKPMALKQLNTFLKEHALLRKRDDEREAAKWGGKGNSRKHRR